MFASRYRVLLFGTVSALLWICTAQAEPQDPKLKSNFGEIKLNADFLPDPHIVKLVAGGNVQTNLGGFPHFVDQGPDYRLTYTAGKFPLIFYAESKADTTLLINLPDGTWIGDDDSGGNLNPRIKFDKPQSGVYNIFVGTIAPKNEDAILFITEVDGKGKGDIKKDVVPPKVNEPDPTLPPSFGSVNLNAGFTPDPHSVKVVAGGPIKSKNGDLEHFVSQAPDFRLNYTAGKYVLTFYAESGADTTLLIRTPDGKWLADDDSGGGVNPKITFNPPLSGVYDIFVGTFAPENAPAVLHITEMKK